MHTHKHRQFRTICVSRGQSSVPVCLVRAAARTARAHCCGAAVFPFPPPPLLDPIHQPFDPCSLIESQAILQRCIFCPSLDDGHHLSEIVVFKHLTSLAAHLSTTANSNGGGNGAETGRRQSGGGVEYWCLHFRVQGRVVDSRRREIRRCRGRYCTPLHTYTNTPTALHTVGAPPLRGVVLPGNAPCSR